jgi:hypothetical protein
MQINGDSKFLRITLGNLITIGFTLVSVIGLYYKMDTRVEVMDMRLGSLEHTPPPTELAARVKSLEVKIDEINPKLSQIGRDTAWLVAREPNAPK